MDVEDAYAKHRHWHKVVYAEEKLEPAVEQAASRAESFLGEFRACLAAALPRLKKP